MPGGAGYAGLEFVEGHIRDKGVRRFLDCTGIGGCDYLRFDLVHGRKTSGEGGFYRLMRIPRVSQLLAQSSDHEPGHDLDMEGRGAFFAIELRRKNH